MIKRTVTPSLIRKYVVLRYIYLEPKTVEELFEACSGIEKRHIISCVASLLSNHAIKKESVIEEPLKVTDEFFDECPKRTKKRTKHRYVILPNGKKKLAFYEWEFQLYSKIPPNVFPWADSFNERYYQEMNDVIKNILKLPT
jgi:hypothetical protein